MKIRSILGLCSALAPLCLAFGASTALIQNTAYAQLPSIAFPAGWPTGVTGQVLDIEPIRMTTATEGEFLYLVDSSLFISRNAGRYGDWSLLSNKIGCADVLPASGSLEKAVAVRDGEVFTFEWDATQSNPVVETSLVGTLTDWDGVTELYVQERAGTQRLYGYDPGQAVIRRADHTNGVWISLSAVSVPRKQVLRDLAFVELKATHAGEELAMLTKYALYIYDDTGTNFIATHSAKPSDAIGVIRNSSAAGDLLVWSKGGLGGYTLEAWNESYSSLPFVLGAEDCTAIHARSNGQYGDHLLLTRGGSCQVDLVQVIPGPTSNQVTLARHLGGDGFAAHENVGQHAIQTSAVGDYDMDGELDLVVASSSSAGLELTYVMTTDVREQTVGHLTEVGIVHTHIGGVNHSFTLPLELGDSMSSNTVLLELWAIKDPSVSMTRELLVSEQHTVAGSAASHSFVTQIEAVSWDLEEAQFFWSVAPVTVNSSNEVTAIHPASSWGWSHSNATLPVVNVMPNWMNAGGLGMTERGNRPRPYKKE